MTTNPAAYTSDYPLSTRSVLYAGRQLRIALDADRARLGHAITRLERTAQQHEIEGTGYRAFMFTELEDTTEADNAIRERMTEGVLASVLTDLQVANVLIAAGQTLGETGEKVEPRLLDEPLLRLENTTRVIESSLRSPLAKEVKPGRFGFAEEVAIPDLVQSSDLPSAIGTIRRRSNETLATLVNDAQEAVISVVMALTKFDKEKVLSMLGGVVQELPKIGRLFRQGVEKLIGAIRALIHLLGSDALARIRVQVEKIWQDVNDGKRVAQALEWAFRVEATRTRIAEILQSQDLKREALDKSSNDLAQLAITFKEDMAMVLGITSTVTLAGRLLTLTPIAGPELALMAASAYGVIMGAIVLIGMGYTDSGLIFRRVRGVGEIVSSVRPA